MHDEVEQPLTVGGSGAYKKQQLGLPHNGVFIFSPVNGIAHR